MSVIITPDNGELTLLSILFQRSGFNFPAGNCKLRLFKNDYTPDQTSIFSSFTEADFSGYAAVDISSAWNAPTTVSHRGQINHADGVFTHNGGGTSNTIYGAYVTFHNGSLSPSDYILWAERFDSSPVIGALGDSVTYTPQLQLYSDS